MWIKICGIQTVADALAMRDAGASAIGLNFFSGSVRCVAVETAAEIRERMSDDLEVVGLFVNHPVEEVVEIVERVKLDIVQFHGDESAESISQIQKVLPNVLVIRAFRPSIDPVPELNRELDALQAENARPARVLVDARVPGVYGGSGHRADWNRLRRQDRPEHWPPFILAGGITPENVTEAIETTQPWGVDVASGVETDGRKDVQRVRALVRAVQEVE